MEHHLCQSQKNNFDMVLFLSEMNNGWVNKVTKFKIEISVLSRYEVRSKNCKGNYLWPLLHLWLQATVFGEFSVNAYVVKC